MGELTADQQRAFCQFVTGAPRLPPGGLAVLSPKLTIVRKVKKLYLFVGLRRISSVIQASGLKSCQNPSMCCLWALALVFQEQKRIVVFVCIRKIFLHELYLAFLKLLCNGFPWDSKLVTSLAGAALVNLKCGSQRNRGFGDGRR